MIGIGILKLGKSVFDHFNRHNTVARKCIDKAENEVRAALNHMDSANVDEIDDVTDLVSANVMDSVENNVVAKRKVRSKAPFRAYLIKIGKAKFGKLKLNEANRMCVRKYLYDACIGHGVLARHIVENVDFATELVFIPTAAELTRLAVKHTRLVQDNKKVASILGVDTTDN